MRACRHCNAGVAGMSLLQCGHACAEVHQMQSAAVLVMSVCAPNLVKLFSVAHLGGGASATEMHSVSFALTERQHAAHGTRSAASSINFAAAMAAAAAPA